MRLERAGAVVGDEALEDRIAPRQVSPGFLINGGERGKTWRESSLKMGSAACGLAWPSAKPRAADQETLLLGYPPDPVTISPPTFTGSSVGVGCWSIRRNASAFSPGRRTSQTKPTKLNRRMM